MKWLSGMDDEGLQNASGNQINMGVAAPTPAILKYFDAMTDRFPNLAVERFILTP